MMTIDELRTWIAGSQDFDGARQRAEQCVTKAIRELGALRAFAQDIMRSWPEGDVDGGELQEAAVRHGLLRETRPAQPCEDGCWCSEYSRNEDFKDGTVRCYRPTALLSPNAMVSGGGTPSA